eukprot:GHRQ01038248.1.p2 GENE.GHRQ01038248.1~~GHRQ01038248.1.p2  ORF type:complete len:135 (-),score=48.15 GHRQ01038248.1:157-561(-)
MQHSFEVHLCLDCALFGCADSIYLLACTPPPQVDADLGLGPGMCQHEQLQHIYEAARLRRAWRVSRGCIDIDLPEAQLKVDQEQLDALRPAVSCTKLSQVGRTLATSGVLPGSCSADVLSPASLPLDGNMFVKS